MFSYPKNDPNNILKKTTIINTEERPDLFPYK